MSFVLAPEPPRAAAVVPIEPGLPKVLRDRGPSSAKHLHAFLGNARVTGGEIQNFAPRSVGEADLDMDVVLRARPFERGRRISPARIERETSHFRRKRARQVLEQVHKVADFADHAAVTLLGIVGPLRGRQPSGIDPVKNGERSVAPLEKLLALAGKGRKSPVEADRENPPGGGVSFGDLVEFSFTYAQRLFDEDVFA